MINVERQQRYIHVNSSRTSESIWESYRSHVQQLSMDLNVFLTV